MGCGGEGSTIPVKYFRRLSTPLHVGHCESHWRRLGQHAPSRSRRQTRGGKDDRFQGCRPTGGVPAMPRARAGPPQYWAACGGSVRVTRRLDVADINYIHCASVNQFSYCVYMIICVFIFWSCQHLQRTTAPAPASQPARAGGPVEAVSRRAGDRCDA